MCSDGARYYAGSAYPHAGCVSGVYRQRSVQDGQLPKTATVTMRAAYDLATAPGLKAHDIPLRQPQPVLSVGGSGQASKESDKLKPRERPEVTKGITQKVKIGCGNLYITVNYDNDGICEVFTNLGRAGGCPSQSEATSRLISTALRSGIDVQSIIEQLRGIRCHSTLRQNGLKVSPVLRSAGARSARCAAQREVCPVRNNGTAMSLNAAPLGMSGCVMPVVRIFKMRLMG